MTTYKEWEIKISRWDRSLLERQVQTLNNIYYEIIDGFSLHPILAIMEAELANRKRGDVKMTIHRGMR